MFGTAYLVARWMWLPLLGCWAAARGVRGRNAMWPCIVVSAAACAWEFSIPSSANIRIDLVAVVPALILSGLVSGGLLVGAVRAHRRAGRAAPPSLLAGLLACFAGPLALAAAWAISDYKSRGQYEEYSAGSRYWFETAFQDDEAQRAAFGELDGTRWSGYYVADPPDALWAHVVVNRGGEFFVFGPTFREERGRGVPDAADEPVLHGPLIRYGHKSGDVALRDLGGGRVAARITDLGAPREVSLAKRPPPRFPRPAAGGKVKFRGVYSARDGDAQFVFVTQLWLWESGGAVWGKLLRQGFQRGQETEVVGHRDAAVACLDAACTSFSVKTEDDAAFTLRREGVDRLVQPHGYQGRDLVFQPGEIVGGFLYDRAPLATPEENRRWLRSLHPLITWTAPASSS
jgi:hypothetical protein